MDSPMTHDDTAQGRYDGLRNLRVPFMHEAAESAALTVPSQFPDVLDIREVQREVVLVNEPYQSLGARGVKSLANKLLLSLLPPTDPFLRYDIDPAAKTAQTDAERATEAQDESEIMVALAAREDTITKKTRGPEYRVKAEMAILQLLITGNITIYMVPGQGLKVFRLNAYVCRRDTAGNLLECITAEPLDRQALDPELLQIAESAGALGDDVERSVAKRDDSIVLYTYIRKDGPKHYTVHQEIAGTVVPSSKVRWTNEKLPWLVLRFTSMDGEDYGRGFVEPYRGDLRSAEGLQESIVLASANAATLIPLVSSNATVTIQDLEKHRNGRFITGEEGDVHFLNIDKGQDLRIAFDTLTMLKQELARDFMLTSSIQRDAERVTAEEWRQMAQELDDNLAGIYSVLSAEWMLPMALRIERDLENQGAIRKLPAGMVTTTIVTGLAAIGRNHDLERLRRGMADLANVIQVVPAVGSYIKPGPLARMILTNAGVPTAELLKTDDEVLAEQQAQQEQERQAQMMDQVTGPVTEAVAKSATEDPAKLQGLLGQGGAGGPGLPQ
jgi:hypothetical protein